MSTWVRKGVTYKASGERISCLFCNIVAGTEPAVVITENEDYVVFKNIRPASEKAHYLVASKVHIDNFQSLSGVSGAKIVSDMVEIGERSLGEYAASAQYSFHIPPFNSIDHLHLHCIANPHEMSWVNWIKYSTSLYWSLSAEEAIKQLNNTSE